MACVITLPVSVGDGTLPLFLAALGEGNSHDLIRLDFIQVRFFTPGAIVGLTAKVHGWLRQGKQIFFSHHHECTAFQYLQRMNLFSSCGIQIPEAFKRRDSTGRFVAMQRVGFDAESDVAKLATAAATCIAPDYADFVEPERSGPFDCVEYAISELALNVLQHSRGAGFMSAQFIPTNRVTRLAIADCGIGIRQSFLDAGSPHCYDGMDDLGAVLKALEPRVSSKSHLSTAWGGGPVNAGVGLTLLRDLAAASGGGFSLISNHGVVQNRNKHRLPNGAGFDGTLCELSFPRDRVMNFFALLQDAKQRARLLSGDAHGAQFT